MISRYLLLLIHPLIIFITTPRPFSQASNIRSASILSHNSTAFSNPERRSKIRACASSSTWDLGISANVNKSDGPKYVTTQLKHKIDPGENVTRTFRDVACVKHRASSPAISQGAPFPNIHRIRGIPRVVCSLSLSHSIPPFPLFPTRSAKTATAGCCISGGIPNRRGNPRHLEIDGSPL